MCNDEINGKELRSAYKKFESKKNDSASDD